MQSNLPAWGISLVMNGSLLLAMWFTSMPSAAAPDSQRVEAVIDDVPAEAQFDLSNSPSERIGNNGAADAATAPGTTISETALAASNLVMQEIVNANPDVRKQLEAVTTLDVQAFATPIEQPHQSTELTKNFNIRTSTKSVADSDGGGPGGGSGAGAGAKGAMDFLTHTLRSSLEDRKTLVVWLFDASGSLNTRRGIIADRFENVYKQLNQLGDTKGLMTAVISFGEKFQILSEPVEDVSTLVEPIRKIKVDESGRENTFETFKFALDHFQHFKQGEKWNKIAIIVTDERGDDAEKFLEGDINQAKKQNFKVYCVGNAAVFGRAKGYIPYVYPDGESVNVEVDQGPETWAPDFVAIPFFGEIGNRWQLDQMSAGYGPYALTRLCAETNGIFILTQDTQGMHFDHNTMARYAPDYRPISIIQGEISKHPCKKALTEAASLKFDHPLIIPKTNFSAYNDAILRTELAEGQTPVADVVYHVDRMLKLLQSTEKSASTLKEPRWQAAYYLALGRLIALNVRYDGYNRTVAAMKVTPKVFEKPDSNEWHLAYADQYESGPQIRNQAAQAKTYLKRVIDDHPGTPWAFLAQKELAVDMGWKWVEKSRPVPAGMKARGLNDKEVAKLLLADEDDKKMKAKKAPAGAPPRPLPKL